jgi:hypothetical protein
MGLEGCYPSRVSRPHVRRDNFVPSVWELGVLLGVWERATPKNQTHVSSRKPKRSTRSCSNC